MQLTTHVEYLGRAGALFSFPAFNLCEIWAFTGATSYIQTNRPKSGTYFGYPDKCNPNQPNSIWTNLTLSPTGFQKDNQGSSTNRRSQPLQSLCCTLSKFWVIKYSFIAWFWRQIVSEITWCCRGWVTGEAGQSWKNGGWRWDVTDDTTNKTCSSMFISCGCCF